MVLCVIGTGPPASQSGRPISVACIRDYIMTVLKISIIHVPCFYGRFKLYSWFFLLAKPSTNVTCWVVNILGPKRK